jgi:eukaryotic-like serine/threonine-protein kinase
MNASIAGPGESKMAGDFRVAEWLVEPQANTVSANGHTVRLEPKVMQVLVCLAEANGVVSKEHLMRTVWADTFVTDDVLTRSISELRKAFGDDPRQPKFIETIPKGGYRLLAPVERSRAEAPSQRSRTLRGARLWLALAMAALAGAGIATLVLWQLRSGAPAATTVISTLRPPPGRLFYPYALALSPDGTRLAYRTLSADGASELWVRSLSTGADHSLMPVRDTLGGNPFWSPDSRYLVLCPDERLSKLEASAESSTVLADDMNGCAGGSWNANDVIVLADRRNLFRMSANGGPRTLLLTSNSADFSVRQPGFLPDGRHFVFWASPDNGKRGLYLGDINAHEKTFLVEAQPSGMYAAPGYLLFRNNNKIMAQRFDARRLRLSGTAMAISPEIGLGEFSVSDTGVLAYINYSNPTKRLLRLSRSGALLGQIGEPANYGPIHFSADGKHLAYETMTQSTKTDVWVYDMARGAAQRVTAEPAWQGVPVLSPDGKQAIFGYSIDGGIYRLHVKAADGSGEERAVGNVEEVFPVDWSQNGRYVAFRQPGAPSVSVLEIADGHVVLSLPEHSQSLEARFSPDDKWLAITSFESGRLEIYVISFADPARKWKVSSDGGLHPAWRNDGKELFYVTASGEVMSVAVGAKGDDLQFLTPRKLFDTHVRMAGPARSFRYFDAAPNGQSFVVNSTVESSEEPITVVTNWTGLLKR